MDISVIIPSRNESELLWATVASARADLESSGFDFEIICVLDGCAPEIASLILHGGMAKAIYTDIGSPQGARHIGAEQAIGKLFVFADSHVIFPPGFFRDLMVDMEEVGADLMHTPNRFLGQAAKGFTVDWDGYLWNAQSIRNDSRPDPFRIAIAGHGGFGIWRDSYFRAGGYWQALKGFGGEETQLNLKLWLMGMSCWMTPRTHHWHWLPPGKHDGSMFSNREFARNFLMVAAAYGDEDQVRRSYRALMLQHWKFEDLYPGLVEDVLADSEVVKEREFMGENAVYRSLGELRDMFIKTGVVN